MSVFIWGLALAIQTEISPETRRTVRSVILICWNIPTDHNSISSRSMLTKQLWINLVSGMNIFTGKLRLVQTVVTSHHSGNVWMTTYDIFGVVACGLSPISGWTKSRFLTSNSEDSTLDLTDGGSWGTYSGESQWGTRGGDQEFYLDFLKPHPLKYSLQSYLIMYIIYEYSGVWTEFVSKLVGTWT